MGWLNPLTWIKILGLLKSLWDIGVAVFSWIAAFLRKRSQDKEIEKIHKAEEKIDAANKVENDGERLKEKADAACEMEQVLDRNHKC